jgi:hypothetical protein
MKDLGQPPSDPDHYNLDINSSEEDENQQQQAQVNKGDQNNEATNDLINYKGIYFEDDSGQKYQCPETGAHFEYLDMYRRLKKVNNLREKTDADEKIQKHE